MPKASKQLDKNDPEYLEKRKRNNEAIKKSREKAKAKAEETQKKVNELKSDNKRLEDKISVLGKEMQFLKDIFLAHAGANTDAAKAHQVAEVADRIASHGVTPNPEQQSIIDDLLFSLDQPGPSDDM